jgi:TM2 domain-containing membrane protein YozV
MTKSSKGFVPTLLLVILLGGIGGHRFYVGKIGSGIAQLLTLGGLGIWTLIDLIMIILGKFTDSEGNTISS